MKSLFLLFVFHNIKNGPSTLDYKQSKDSKPLSEMEHNPQGDVQETRDEQQFMSHMISLFTLPNILYDSSRHDL